VATSEWAGPVSLWAANVEGPHNCLQMYRALIAIMHACVPPAPWPAGASFPRRSEARQAARAQNLKPVRART